MMTMIKKSKSSVSTGSKLQATGGTSKALLVALLFGVAHGARDTQSRAVFKVTTDLGIIDKNIGAGRMLWRDVRMSGSYHQEGGSREDGGQEIWQVMWKGTSSDSPDYSEIIQFTSLAFVSKKNQHPKRQISIDVTRLLKGGVSPIASKQASTFNVRFLGETFQDDNARFMQALSGMQIKYKEAVKRADRNWERADAARAAKAEEERRLALKAEEERRNRAREAKQAAALNAYAAGTHTENIDDAFNAVIAAWEKKYPRANAFTVQQLTNFLRYQNKKGAGYSNGLLSYTTLKKLCTRVGHDKFAGQ